MPLVENQMKMAQTVQKSSIILLFLHYVEQELGITNEKEFFFVLV